MSADRTDSEPVVPNLLDYEWRLGQPFADSAQAHTATSRCFRCGRGGGGRMHFLGWLRLSCQRVRESWVTCSLEAHALHPTGERPRTDTCALSGLAAPILSECEWQLCHLFARGAHAAANRSNGRGRTRATFLTCLQPSCQSVTDSRVTTSLRAHALPPAGTTAAPADIWLIDVSTHLTSHPVYFHTLATTTPTFL